MEQNIGQNDRIIRYVLGIVFMMLGIVLAVQTSQILGIVLIVVSVILLVTAVLNVCPIYLLLDKSTKTSEIPSSE